MLAYKSFEVDILGDDDDVVASYKDSVFTVKGLSVEKAMRLLPILEKLASGEKVYATTPEVEFEVKPTPRETAFSFSSHREAPIMPRKEVKKKDNEIFLDLEKAVKEKEQYTFPEWAALSEEVERALEQYLITDDEEQVLFRWLNARKPIAPSEAPQSFTQQTFSVRAEFDLPDPNQIALSFVGKDVLMPPTVSGEIAKTEAGRTLAQAFQDADNEESKAQEKPEDDDEELESLNMKDEPVRCEAPGCDKKETELPEGEYVVGDGPDFAILCLDCEAKQKAAKSQQDAEDEFDREVARLNKKKEDEALAQKVQEHKANTSTPAKELEQASQQSQRIEEKLLNPAPKVNPEAPTNGFLSDMYLALKEEIAGLGMISLEDAKPFKKRIAEWGNTSGATQDQCLVLTNLLGTKIESVLTSGELPKRPAKPKAKPAPVGDISDADDQALKAAETVRQATHYLMSRGVTEPAAVVAKIEAIAPSSQYLSKVQGLRGRIETAISTFQAK